MRGIPVNRFVIPLAENQCFVFVQLKNKNWFVRKRPVSADAYRAFRDNVTLGKTPIALKDWTSIPPLFRTKGAVAIARYFFTRLHGSPYKAQFEAFVEQRRAA